MAWVFACFRGGANRPESISVHATERPLYLFLHRVFHVLISLSLISYAVFYLRAELGLLLPVILLVVGALMDIVEVVTLDEHTPTGPNARDFHQVTAWIMAFCYMFFAISMAKHAGYSALAINAVWIVFVVLIAIAAKLKYRRFWAFQMSYFLVLSVFIVTTHFSISA